jgi:hypothetical protein
MDATRLPEVWARNIACVAQKPHRAFHLLRKAGFLGIDSARSFYFAVQQLSVDVGLE